MRRQWQAEAHRSLLKARNRLVGVTARVGWLLALVDHPWTIETGSEIGRSDDGRG